MSLMTPEQTNQLPASFRHGFGNRPETGLQLIGTSMWGQVYRAEDQPYCYRIIPIEDVSDPHKRVSIRSWIGQPRKPNIAPLVEAEQCEINRSRFFYIAYEISPDITWPQVLESNDDARRIGGARAILECIARWWQSLHARLLPMPADIVFLGGAPWILALPFIGWPKIEQLLRRPARIGHLATELVRGRATSGVPENTDMYAFGRVVLPAVYQVEDGTDPEIILAEAARGGLYAREKMTERLPSWTRDFQPMEELKDSLCQLVDPDPTRRSRIHPKTVSAAMEDALPLLDPLVVAQNHRKKGEPDESLQVIKEALVNEPSYELLCLAGDISHQDLDLSLEAVGYYERAITKHPEREEAYSRQLSIFLDKTVEVLLRSLQGEASGEGQGKIFSRLDRSIDRDFQAIGIEKREKLIARLADYWNKREEFAKAANILHPYLFDQEGTYLWWEFPRTLAYAESYIGLARLDEAENFLKGIKNGIAKLRANNQMSPQLLNGFQSEAKRLSDQIAAKRGQV